MTLPLSIDVDGDIIIARLQGVPSEELLRECQYQVRKIMMETGRRKVIYDVLNMEAPTLDVTLLQQELVAEVESLFVQQAIVVPTCQIAYLARLAFGDGNYRVFYDDLTAACIWLSRPLNHSA